MKRSIWLILPLTFYAAVHSQTADNYFVTTEDTIFCSRLEYRTNMQGYLSWISYEEVGGNEVEIKGKRKVPDVLTFFIDGVFTDKTPLFANKPDGYIRYTKRAVDGKLKVYLARQGTMTDRSSGNPFETNQVASGIYRFYLKMPDGTYYKINSKPNLKKYIKPYLLECEEFNSQYNGDFSLNEEPFMEMIRLYNSLCD